MLKINTDLFIGIGIGILITTLILSSFNQQKAQLGDLEQSAREQGMIYRNECKVLD